MNTETTNNREELVKEGLLQAVLELLLMKQGLSHRKGLQRKCVA